MNRKRKPLWLKALLGLVLAGTVTFGALFGAVFCGAHDHVRGDPQVMVILGCQVKPWGPSVLLQDRLDKALDYLEDHPDLIIVVSGGQGPDEPVSEARCMYDYLTEHGVDGAQILMEDHPTIRWKTCAILWTCWRKRGTTPLPIWWWCPRLPPDPGADAVEPGMRGRL